jgi:transcriptional regulator with XRE-family HTH domain
MIIDKKQPASKEQILKQRIALGQKIATKRKSLNINQQDLADFVGLSKNTISKIEIGKFSFNFDTIFKIMDALNIRIQYDDYTVFE